MQESFQESCEQTSVHPALASEFVELIDEPDLTTKKRGPGHRPVAGRLREDGQ